MASHDQARLEILRLARDLVVGEYNNRRAQAHNQWLVDSDQLWKASRLRLAYPPIPPYPTEADILARAESLMGFVGVKDISLPSVPDVPVPPVSEDPAPAPSTPPPDTDLPSMLKRIEDMRHRLENSVGSDDRPS
jgi:hypothetical protein